MKYANSVKYLKSFDLSGDISEISAARVAGLCRDLGKINVGPKFIHISGASASHGCALFIESIIKNAGYRVGRINTAYKFDIMKTVYIDRQIPVIDDYNKAVAAIRQIVNKKSGEIYKREEIVFVFSLMVCMLEGCEFVILEECINEYPGLFEICAPYEIAVIPSGYGKEPDTLREQKWSNTIKLVRHEVISGNQKTDTYNIISDKCRLSGTRLAIPAKAQFVPTEIDNRNVAFEYKGKSNYKIKSISLLLRDCAMTAIETVNSLRRSGIKISGNAICQGLLEAGNAGFCEIISASPLIITDISSMTEEITVLRKSLDSLSSDFEKSEKVICFGAENAREAINKLKSAHCFSPAKIYIFTPDANEELTALSEDSEAECVLLDSIKNLAELILRENREDRITVCFGEIDFIDELKKCIFDTINERQ